MRLGVHFNGNEPHLRVWMGPSGIVWNHKYVGRLLGPVSFWNLATNPVTRDDANNQYVIGAATFPFAYPGGGYNLDAYCYRWIVCKCATHDGSSYSLGTNYVLGPCKGGWSGTSPSNARPFITPLRPSVTPPSEEEGWDLSGGYVDANLYGLMGLENPTDSDVPLKYNASTTFTINTTRLYDALAAGIDNFLHHIPVGCAHDLLIAAEQWALWEVYREDWVGDPPELQKVSAGKIADGNTKLVVFPYVYAPVEACAVP